jgi:hypothetical protein
MPGKGRTGSVASRLVTPLGIPPLSSQRLRATWLLSHIRMGKRLPELIAAAGLASTTSLIDLIPLVEPLREDQALWQLRGRP